VVIGCVAQKAKLVGPSAKKKPGRRNLLWQLPTQPTVYPEAALLGPLLGLLTLCLQEILLMHGEREANR